MDMHKVRYKKIVFDSFSKDGHIIDDVPYVGQETSIFCSYACPTMIFKYYGSNINLDDFVFGSGLGYSLGYYRENKKYFPVGGTFLSQWPLDKKYVAALYGLEYESWFPTDWSCSLDKTWNNYWKKLKEYIKNDIPISTGVDVLALPSTRNMINPNLWINSNKIPDFAWKLISTAHEIVIVGFDEEKKLVYYNDPVASVIGKDEDGIYTSAPLNVFARAVASAGTGKINPKFLINAYKKVNSPLSDEMVFKKSHDRNIEKLKGNAISYDEKWQDYKLGLNALYALRNDFEMILNKKNFDLISLYRLDSFKLAIMERGPLFFVKKSSRPIFNDTFINPYDTISIEKKYAYEYIKNNSVNFRGLEDEIELLGQELEIWKLISNFYSRFYKEFILSTKNNKIKKINEYLVSNISEIINIEKNISEIYLKSK
jgi:hypothetical protein